MNELNRLSLDQFRSQEKWPFVVVLDNVRSIYNVGSIMRTCDAFLCNKLYLCGITVQPPHKELSKTAIGAEKTVDWVYFSQTTEAIQELKSQGYFIVGIEQTKLSVSLENLQYPNENKIAFVLGNEVDGVSEEVLKLCDVHCEIPQFGSKHSFNVSVTCGMILWEFARKFKFKHLSALFISLATIFSSCYQSTQRCSDHSAESSNANKFAQNDSVKIYDEFKRIVNDTHRPAKIFITFSTECPISKLHVSDLQYVVNQLSVMEDLGEKPLLKVIYPAVNSKPYPWLESFAIVDTHLWWSKAIGATVYPEMVVYNRIGREIYRGKLSNRAMKTGEMSMVKTAQDSSYLKLIFNQIEGNGVQKPITNLCVKSNQPAGCYIEY